jgi:hypothetical protein
MGLRDGMMASLTGDMNAPMIRQFNRPAPAVAEVSNYINSIAIFSLRENPYLA